MSFESALILTLHIDQALRQEKLFTAAMKRIEKESKDVAGGLARVERAMKEDAAATDKNTKSKKRFSAAAKATSRATAFLNNAIRRLAQALALAAAAVAFLAVKLATDFEQEMVKIETLVGLNRKMVQGWTADILALSIQTGQTAKALARGLFAITSGGERGAQAMDQLAIAAKAAAIGLGDVRDLGRLGAAILQAYGKELKTSAQRTELFAKSMDTLLEAVRLGNIEAHELSTTVGRAIGPAEALGISFEQLAGFIATFSRLGVPAAEVVTSLNSTFTTLIRTSEQAEKSLRQYGLSIEGIRKRIRDDGFAETLVFLVNTYKDNVTGLQEVISNIRALRGVLGTASAQQENFLRISKLIEHSSDAVNKAFKRQKQTAAQAFKDIRSSWSAVLILMGEKTLPVLRRVADQMERAFTSVEVREAFIELGDVAAMAIRKMDIDGLVRKIEHLVKAITFLVKHSRALKIAFKGAFALGVVAIIVKIIAQIKLMVLAVKSLGLAIAAISWNPWVAGIGIAVGLVLGYLYKLEAEMDRLQNKAENARLRYMDSAELIEELKKANADVSVTVKGVTTQERPLGLGENTLDIYEQELKMLEDQVDMFRIKIKVTEDNASKAAWGLQQYEAEVEKLNLIDNKRDQQAKLKLDMQKRLNEETVASADFKILELQKEQSIVKTLRNKLELQVLINKNLDQVPSLEELEIPKIKGAELQNNELGIVEKISLALANQQAALEHKNELLDAGVDIESANIAAQERVIQQITEYNRQKRAIGAFEEQVSEGKLNGLLKEAKAVDDLEAKTKKRIKLLKQERAFWEKLSEDQFQYRKDIAAQTLEIRKQIKSIKELGRVSIQAQAELQIEKAFTAEQLQAIKDTEGAYEALEEETIALIKANNELAASFTQLQRDRAVMIDFAFAASKAISEAMATALMGGDMTPVLQQTGDMMGNLLGQKIGNAVAKEVETALLNSGMEAILATQISGAVAAGVTFGISMLVSYAVQRILSDKNVYKSFGSVATPADYSSLQGAADELKEAARALMDAADQFKEITGFGFTPPGFTLSKNDDTFRAMGLGAGGAGGTIGEGSSIDEAIKDFFFKIIKGWGDLFTNSGGSEFWKDEMGLEGWEGAGVTFNDNFEYFMGIVSRSIATGWDELERDLEKGKEILDASMGKAAADINEAMSEMVQMAADGLRLGIDSGILNDALTNSILDSVAAIAGAPEIVRMKGVTKAFENLRDEIRKLGLGAEETASIIEQIDLYEQLKVLSDIGGVFDRVLSAMERAGVRNAQVEKEIAIVKQAQFQVEMKLLEAQLKALELWTSAMATTFSALEKWGKNLDNFVNEIVNNLGGADDEPDDKKAAERWRKQQQELIKDWIYASTHSDLEIALRNLKKEFDKYMKLMFVFGEGKVPGKWTDKLIAAYEAYQRKIYMDFFAPLMEFRDQLRDKPTGQTPVRSLLGAKARYEDLLAKALAGDEEAALQLAEAGQEYLDVAQQMYGSSRRYRVIQESILSQIESVLSQWDLDTKSMEEYAEENLDVLNEMLAMMPDELDMLTQIRDVLLGTYTGGGGGLPDDRFVGPPDALGALFGTRDGTGGGLLPPMDIGTRMQEAIANDNFEAMNVSFSEYHSASLVLDTERNEILVDIRDYVADTYEESSTPRPIEESRRAGVI